MDRARCSRSCRNLPIPMQFLVCLFFFFKQKTAYDITASDWSSDVCSSDLLYVTEPTMDAMKRILPQTFGKRLRRVETIQPGQRFTIGDIDVHAFAIPHDAADPIGFTF